MKTKNELLEQFIVSTHSDGDESSYLDYLKLIWQEYAKNIRNEAKITNFKTQLNEFIEGSTIKLNGDDILVNGKVVAKLINDLDDLENDMYILFPDGKKVPVQNAKAAYEFIRNRFLTAGQE